MVRIGVRLPQYGSTWSEIRDTAVRVVDPVGGGSGWGNCQPIAYGPWPELGLADDRPYMAITYFQGVTFKAPGKYIIRVSSNGREALSYPLYLTQAEPEPEE